MFVIAVCVLFVVRGTSWNIHQIVRTAQVLLFLNFVVVIAKCRLSRSRFAEFLDRKSKIGRFVLKTKIMKYASG